MKATSMRTLEIEEACRLPLLRSVQDSYRQSLLHGAYLQKFPAHVELIREGDTPDFLHVIIDGRVEVYADHAGRETTISVLGAGSCFIVAAVLLDRPYLKSARVNAQCRILMIPAESVRSVFGKEPEFTRALTGDLALAYREVVKELKNQKLRPSLERVAAWIVRQNTMEGGNNTFDIPFEKKTLASRLGMVPEVLSRSFLNLKAYGVEVLGRTIRLDDVAALTKLAKPNPYIDDPNI